MDFIKKGFPKTKFLDFPEDRWSTYSSSLGSPLNSLPDNKDNLLEMLVKALLKEYYWDSENADEKRTLKMLPQLAKSIEIEKGHGLMSLRVYTHSKRGKQINTHVEYAVDLPEKMDAPANADYNQDYINSGETVRVEGEYYNLLQEGIPCESVFSIEHKNRSDEPSIPCDHCHGSGVIKCPQCGGAGRETYVDGYFASGEERIKTGACSECGGTGRVPCPECNGEGSVDIFAPHYSLVRSVDEIISKRVEGLVVLPDQKEHFLSHSLDLREWDRDDKTSFFDCKYALDEVNKEGQFVYWKMNNKTFVEDNRDAIKKSVDEFGISDKYQIIVDSLENSDDEAIRQRGDIVSLKEALYYFPVVTVKIEYGDHLKSKFLIYEDDGKACVKLMRLYGMSIGEVLKNKILSLLKK